VFDEKEFDKEFSMSCMCETKREGHVLVAFFGDGSYGWLDQTELVQFDSHYVEKSKQTNAKVFLIKAVEEADDDIRRRAAYGLLCPCRSLYSFRPMHVDGVLQVDICGYEAGGLYTVEQIRSARAAFQSVEMLDFKQMALMPCMNFKRRVPWIKNVATLLAYRREVFEEHDETHFKALAWIANCIPCQFKGGLGTEG
jgi:DNA (cytosine-5)-methyltransferase 3A